MPKQFRKMISWYFIVAVTFTNQYGLVAASNSSNTTCTIKYEECKKGIILPLWEPRISLLGSGDKAVRATVYMASLMYMFLGISIVSDRFMAAIEIITSKEKDIVVKKPEGGKETVSVRIWNETVSNLTLMALGSSAPEILLSIIEICFMNKFEAGDLGPSTIVGSAAYNIFIIIAICVVIIPENEVRRIKHLRVFFITAAWSIFAYAWLYFILAVSSYGIVEIWEAVLTFIFFPITVFTAYVADKNIFFCKFLSKKYINKQTGKVVQCTEDALNKASTTENIIFADAQSHDQDVREFEHHRHEFIDLLKELRKHHPNVDTKQLEDMAEFEAINRGPKSRAFYRIQATRKLIGRGNIIKKTIERRANIEDVIVETDNYLTRVFFDPGHYTVMENVGTFNLTVSRSGGDLSKTLYVDYKTEDGTAKAGSDFQHASGTLRFYPNEIHKQFPLTIIDDDVFEEDEYFYVRLSNQKIGNKNGMFESDTSVIAKLETPFLATVMILDDDHSGIFHFEEKEMCVSEAVGEVEIKVIRSVGARGTVKVPYHTIHGTSLAKKDYEPAQGDIIFNNDETEKTIKIIIFNDDEYEKNEHFFVELGEPYLWKRSSDDGQQQELGRPRLGEIVQIKISIKESQEFKNIVDKLLKNANPALLVGTSSWKEQLREAFTINSGDDEEKLPSCSDYVIHFLTLFWKVLFAIVPPTDYWGGWACFFVSIIFIGILTAFVGDLASAFGCTIGLKDVITAVSFVALGTSLPDTFASKVVAISDPYADSSIANVMGSNAVNVFLGIGLAWTIAALYHAHFGKPFIVEPGTLAFSVTLFCVEAVLCIAVLMFRRGKVVGGELGGPKLYRYITSIFLVFLWVLYILLSAMVAYCYIRAF